MESQSAPALIRAPVRVGLLILIWVSHLTCPAATPVPPKTHEVTLRDGVRLATDVYLPAGEGPWPVILLRFPYNKALAAGVGPDASQRGYAFVAQDTRGRFGSEGRNLPFEADGHADGLADGADTVRWILGQEWCNGRIGTWGGSAGAITQYLLSVNDLKEVVSQHLVVGTPDLFLNGMYRGGIFRKSLVEDWLQATRFDPDALDHWTTNHVHNAYWQARELSPHYARVHAAGVHIGGWYDIFAQATLDAFLGYQSQGAPGARGRQRLIMGPWTHGVLTEKSGERTFPGAATTPGNAHDAWQWFDHTLKQVPSSTSTEPAVLYYIMGSDEPDAPGNEWRTASTWPPVPTRRTPLHLHADGTASWQAGWTSPPFPTNPHLSLTYRSDPENPVPTIGGYELTLPAGPRDQRPIESRPDLLVFTSPPLEAPMEIIGQPVARLRWESSAPDTDVIVRLCDVYPDGRSMPLCEGALRLRFRGGFDREIPMNPGEVVDLEIPLWTTCAVIHRGHRLRVHVASSSTPALEPNLQNGLPPRTGLPQVATNTIHFAVRPPAAEGQPLLSGSWVEVPVAH